MQTIIDEYRNKSVVINEILPLLSNVKRYIVRAIVLFFCEISSLCEISFPASDISFTLFDILFPLNEKSFQFIVTSFPPNK